MDGQALAALVYATIGHSPAVISKDVLTDPDAEDDYAKGSNRMLSPTLGEPALSVAAGFTPGGFPVSLELLGRPFTEGLFFGFGNANAPPGTGTRRSSRIR
ncbi:MAG: hypothetical protein OXT72_09165 [Gammaproteobacteria bacterium]|nr:hypothetical protein [Gammaproteobacteria bacterium]MDE0247300.1 hypothetical protein [Gammaproteobacteria bacterium]